MSKNKLFFDRQDYELLRFVNKILLMQGDTSQSVDMLNVNLHPHGIKTLALSREMRVANSMIRLLGSTQGSDSNYRLQALRTLYDEVLNSAKTDFRRNTARVLVEIMKDLVRSHGDIKKQLYLAHDFRSAAKGKPSEVRKFLQYYGLVEMPEDWSQLAFDHHIHDVNSKGRKSATNLIMDAWLRGIRYITVIYYNYINEESANELLHAAGIIGIHLRIGIEFSLRFAQKNIQFIWSPHYTNHPERFLEFLAEAPVKSFMDMGKQASVWHQRIVFVLLDVWNDKHMPKLALDVGLNDNDFPRLCQEKFKQFVGVGQASASHLAEFIFTNIAPILKKRRVDILDQIQNLTQEEQEAERRILQTQHDFLDLLNEEYIFDFFASESANTDLENQFLHDDNAELPDIMTLTPLSLLDWLSSLQANSFITLNLRNLTAEDVLVLLWQCQGLITHLELYNMRDWNEEHALRIKEINLLQQAINARSVPRLKAIILKMLKERQAIDVNTLDNIELHEKRIEILNEILLHIVVLRNFYATSKLRSRMGTNSTDRIASRGKMGLVFPETLTPRAQKILKKQGQSVKIPFNISIRYVVSYNPVPYAHSKTLVKRLISSLPFCEYYDCSKTKEWRTSSGIANCTVDNNVSLLHIPKRKKCKFEKELKTPPLRYLNSPLQNILKVILGFIPAAFAFYYTQTWWVLAWFGPIIWFAITGVRNIIQAVVAGTGFYRYSRLRWKDHVSWSRLCDSLLYTGFSVPILELGVRIMLLQNTLHVNAIDSPLFVYTVMSVVNGFYISWHNLVRGLPKEAVIGNLFRSALAIPVAILFSEIYFDILKYVIQVEDPNLLLETTSAIVSKLASDSVAAIIEGYADQKNIFRLRHWDYVTKLDDAFNTYVSIDLAFPQEETNDILVRPRILLKKLDTINPKLKEEVIINALDFMYFWYYRPRSRQECMYHLRKMSNEERRVFGLLQMVLLQEKDVSQLFVDGIVGRNFGPSLAFYLEKHKDYVKHVLATCSIKDENEEEQNEFA